MTADYASSWYAEQEIDLNNAITRLPYTLPISCFTAMAHVPALQYCHIENDKSLDVLLRGELRMDLGESENDLHDENWVTSNGHD